MSSSDWPVVVQDALKQFAAARQDEPGDSIFDRLDRERSAALTLALTVMNWANGAFDFANDLAHEQLPIVQPEDEQPPAVIQQLRDALSDAQSKLETMIKTIEAHESRADDDAAPSYLDGAPDPADMQEFLEDVGLDPHALPGSMGERMEIRDKLLEKRDWAALQERLEIAESDRDYYQEQVKAAECLGFDAGVGAHMATFTCNFCREISDQYNVRC